MRVSPRMGNTTFFHGLAKRRAAFAFLLPVLLLCVFAALTCITFLGGCTQSETVAAATAIPVPGASVVQTIRTRVAAVVKREVQAHPAVAPWVNGLAKTCFEVSGFALPAPGVLQTLFGAASAFAPRDITGPVSSVLALYAADYPSASAIQGGSQPYLTALGQGIQDGVKAAGVSEAP